MQEAKLAEVQAKGHRATAGLEEARRIGSAAEDLLQKSSPLAGHQAQWQVEQEQLMTGKGTDRWRGGGSKPRSRVRTDKGAPKAADSWAAQMQPEGALQQKPGGALAKLYKAGTSFFSSPVPETSSLRELRLRVPQCSQCLVRGGLGGGNARGWGWVRAFWVRVRQIPRLDFLILKPALG
eukprot:3669879-Rhodomonas_salina.2